jgi:ketosteroid isomerase-like protein
MVALSSEADCQKVIDVANLEMASVAAGDSDGYLALLTDDAVFMPPNTTAKAGHELRNWLCDFLERVTVEWLTFTHCEAEVAGGLAFHCFTYSWRVTPKAGGEPTIGHGKGIHILRRQPNGDWKIARELWNASPAG